MALDFDGTDDLITYMAGLDLSDGLPFTIALTVSRDVGSTINEYLIDITAGAARHLLWLNASQNLLWQLFTDGTALQRNADSSGITDNQFDTVIVTSDGSLTAINTHIHVNGTELTYGSSVNGTGNINPSTDLNLFGRTSDNLRNFDGKGANLGVWRVELNAEERALYDLGYVPKLVRENALVLEDWLVDKSEERSHSITSIVTGTTVFPHPDTIFYGPPKIDGRITQQASSSLGTRPMGTGSQLLVPQRPQIITLLRDLTLPPSLARGPIELDKQSWLAKDLEYWWPEPHSKDVWRDHSRKQRGALILEAGTPILTPTRFGSKSMDFGGSAEFTETDVDSLEGLSAFSIGFWAKASSYVQDTAAISINNGGDVNSLFVFYPYDSLGGNGARIFFSQGNVPNQTSGAASLGEDHWFFFTARASDDYELYVDGLPVATGSGPRSLAATLSNIDFGHWNGIQNYHGDSFGLTIHTKGFTSDEVARWYFEDRWGLYKRQPKKTFVSVPAKSKPTIKIGVVGKDIKPSHYQLNPDHFITQRGRLITVLDGQGGNINLIDNSEPVVVGTLTPVVSDIGRALEFTHGTADLLNYGNNSRYVPGELGIYVVATWNGIADSGFHVLVERDFTSAAEPFYSYRIIHSRSTGLPVTVQWNQEGTRFSITDGVFEPTQDVPFAVVLSIKEGEQKLYAGDLGFMTEQGTALTQTGTITDYGTDTLIGQSELFSSHSQGGLIYSAVIVEGGISLGEVDQLNKDPFGFLGNENIFTIGDRLEGVPRQTRILAPKFGVKVNPAW